MYHKYNYKVYFILLLASICTLQAYKRSYNRQRVHTSPRSRYAIPPRIQQVLYKHRFKRIDHYFPWQRSFDLVSTTVLLIAATLMTAGAIYVFRSDLFDIKERNKCLAAWLVTGFFVLCDIGLILEISNDYYVSQHPGCILLTNNALLLMEPGKNEYTWLPYKHIKAVIDPYRTDDFVYSVVNERQISEVIFWLKVIPTKDAQWDVQRIAPKWIGEKNYETLKAYFKKLGLLVEFSQF